MTRDIAVPRNWTRVSLSKFSNRQRTKFYCSFNAKVAFSQRTKKKKKKRKWKRDRAWESKRRNPLNAEEGKCFLKWFWIILSLILSCMPLSSHLYPVMLSTPSLLPLLKVSHLPFIFRDFLVPLFCFMGWLFTISERFRVGISKSWKREAVFWETSWRVSQIWWLYVWSAASSSPFI